MLASAFRVFDPEGKGFITETDLGRVLSDLGKGSSANELHETLQEAARADREGKRVLYGDFVELMSQTNKRLFAKGDAIFREGDAPDGFHLLLKGSVEVSKGGQRLATLRSGEYFGENALLSGASRDATIKCLEDVEVLLLSREDFEAGFLQPSATADGSAVAARQTLSFIQMVSSMQRSTLAKGECAFRAGDPGDRFYIIEEGTVRVEIKDQVVNRLHKGNCFGELALLSGETRNATVRCETRRCALLSMDVSTFTRTLRKSAALHADLSTLAATRTDAAAPGGPSRA